MENDPVTLIVALDDDFNASGQVYFDDGITHDWQDKNEFILGNLSITKGQINYRYEKDSDFFIIKFQPRFNFWIVRRSRMGRKN